jgi:hypothetical protein
VAPITPEPAAEAAPSAIITDSLQVAPTSTLALDVAINPPVASEPAPDVAPVPPVVTPPPVIDPVVQTSSVVVQTIETESPPSATFLTPEPSEAVAPPVSMAGSLQVDTTSTTALDVTNTPPVAAETVPPAVVAPPAVTLPPALDLVVPAPVVAVESLTSVEVVTPVDSDKINTIADVSVDSSTQQNDGALITISAPTPTVGVTTPALPGSAVSIPILIPSPIPSPSPSPTIAASIEPVAGILTPVPPGEPVTPPVADANPPSSPVVTTPPLAASATDSDTMGMPPSQGAVSTNPSPPGGPSPVPVVADTGSGTNPAAISPPTRAAAAAPLTVPVPGASVLVVGAGGLTVLAPMEGPESDGSQQARDTIEPASFARLAAWSTPAIDTWAVLLGPIVPLSAPSDARAEALGPDGPSPLFLQARDQVRDGDGDGVGGATQRDELGSTDDPPIGPDSAPDEVEDPHEVLSGAEEANDPGPKVTSWSRPAPVLSDLLARAFGLDPAALERAIDKVLADAYGIGMAVSGRLEAMDLWAWLMAASVTAAALEITRREARRARIDAIASWSEDLLLEGDS